VLARSLFRRFKESGLAAPRTLVDAFEEERKWFSKRAHLLREPKDVSDITELRKKQEQEFQLQLARDVQQRFYAAAPVISGFDIAGSAHPADETGGDYFDFIPMPQNRVAVMLGDVAGKGVSAALLMARLSAAASFVLFKTLYVVGIPYCGKMVLTTGSTLDIFV
jgi:hypothetical protein